jgi:hypothetical protein
MKFTEGPPTFDDASEKDLEGRELQNNFEDFDRQKVFFSSSNEGLYGNSSRPFIPRLPIYSDVCSQFNSFQKTEKLETSNRQTGQLKSKVEIDPRSRNLTSTQDIEHEEGMPVPHFLHLALHDSVTSKNSFRLSSALLPMALGLLEGSYSFTRSLLLSAWTLLTLPVNLGPAQREKNIALMRDFSLILFALLSGNSSLRHQAKLKLYRIATLIALNILESLEKDWDNAQTPEEKIRLLSNWSIQTILTFLTPFGTVKFLGKALQFSKINSIRVPLCVIKKFTQFEHKIQAFLKKNPAAAKELAATTQEIPPPASTSINTNALKGTVLEARTHSQAHLDMGIVDSAGGLKAFSNKFPEHEIGIPIKYDLQHLAIGQKVGGRLNFVVTENEKLIIGKRFDGLGGGHIDLAGGQPVLAAGEIKIIKGKIYYIDNSSGHYEPHGISAQLKVEKVFIKAGFKGVDGKYIEKVWDKLQKAWVPKK